MTQKLDEPPSSHPEENGPQSPQQEMGTGQAADRIEEQESLPPQEFHQESTPEDFSPAEEVVQPEQAAEEPSPPVGTEQAVQDSKLRRAIRKGVLWILLLLIVFLSGGLTVYFTVYQPVRNQLDQALVTLETERQNIASLQEQIASQEKQISALQNQITEFTSQQEALNEQLDAANLHILILRAHTDINAARLSILDKNLEEADLYLANAPDLMADISEQIGSQQADVIAAIQGRLELVLDEFQRDPETAEGDLKIIAERLTQLENTLFTLP